jgi:hypothetical protein
MSKEFQLLRSGYALLTFFAISVLACGCSDRLRYQASRPTVTPDGQKIVFGSDHATDGDVYSIATDGSGLQRLTSGPSVKGWPAMSPDGRSIAYAVESEPSGPWHIFEMNADGGHPVQITSGKSSDVAPAFSPNGTQILFARAASHRPYSMGGITWDHWDVLLQGRFDLLLLGPCPNRRASTPAGGDQRTQGDGSTVSEMSSARKMQKVH